VKSITLITQNLILTAALTLVGCGAITPGPEIKLVATAASGATAIKRYSMHGKVVSLDAANKKARIDAGPIGDWMPTAMTMNYLVKDDAEFAKLSAGQTIDATVFVQGDDDSWIGEIKPVK
jgi:Cu/Ag efflux protein CusF